jgi:hypothetical protein
MPGLHAVLVTFTSALLAVPPLSDEPVPIQRPAALEPAASIETEPETTAAEPAPTVVPDHEVATRGRPGRIEGIAHDAEAEDREVAGARVELLCSCLPDPLTTITDESGRFVFDDLPAGEYTLFIDRGGEVSTQLLALPAGAHRTASLQVAQPFSTDLLERERRELTRGRVMISVGGVAAATAVLMLISAGVEAAKPECRFGPDACENPPRPGLIGAFAGVGAALLLGGGAMVVAGVRRVRRVNPSLQLDGRSAGVSLAGRF